VAPGVREESEVVRRTLQDAEEGLRKAQQAVALLREVEARHSQEFNEERRSMLLRALRSQYHLAGQRDQALARKQELDAELLVAPRDPNRNRLSKVSRR
jgi:hypothetical protein